MVRNKYDTQPSHTIPVEIRQKLPKIRHFFPKGLSRIGPELCDPVCFTIKLSVAFPWPQTLIEDGACCVHHPRCKALRLCARRMHILNIFLTTTFQFLAFSLSNPVSVNRPIFLCLAVTALPHYLWTNTRKNIRNAFYRTTIYWHFSYTDLFHPSIY